LTEYIPATKSLRGDLKALTKKESEEAISGAKGKLLAIQDGPVDSTIANTK
jgi:hypothetical protein